MGVRRYVFVAVVAVVAGAAPALGQDDTCGDAQATVLGTAGPDHLVGTTEPDLVQARGGDDHVEGLDGRDALCGGPGNDLVDGGAGDDTVFAEDGDDTVLAGGDRDFVDGGLGADVLRGDEGDDGLQGGDGDDTLIGGAGNDRLLATDETPPQDTRAPRPQPPGGADLIAGGPGLDTVLDYVGRLAAVQVSLDGTANDGENAEGDNVAGDVEVVRSGKADDRLVGNAGPNRLHGAAGDDRLIGELGTDLLDGGDGDDSLTARDGVQDAIVDCGPGAGDFATVDLKDTAFATGNRVFGCETVFSGAVDEEPNQVIARRARRAGGAVLVRIRCPRGLADACAGRLSVRSANGRRRLAGARYAVPPGTVRAVRVVVGGRARRLRAVAVEPGLHGLKTTVQALRVRR